MLIGMPPGALRGRHDYLHFYKKLMLRGTYIVICQGQNKVCLITLDVRLDRLQTTFQIRKLAGLKADTLGPTSELLVTLSHMPCLWISGSPTLK